MKKTFTLLFIALASAASAQQQFAPKDAQWFHEMSYGIFRTTSVGDTVINGRTCRKVVQEAGVRHDYYAQGLRVSNLPTLYLSNTDNGDTVFLYNSFKKDHTPLYVFNVKAGDTVTLPAFPASKGYYMKVTDTLFSFVVDSVSMVKYDTATLETVYARSIPKAGQYQLDYGGAYARRIGSVKNGLLPNCIGCPIPTGDNVQWPGAVRCYHDQSLAVTMVTDQCNKGINVSVNDVAKQVGIRVYPNPATSYINFGINLPTAQHVSVKLVDAMGRLVKQSDIAITTKAGGNVSVNITKLRAGIYYYQLTTADGNTIQTGQFVKQ